MRWVVLANTVFLALLAGLVAWTSIVAQDREPSTVEVRYSVQNLGTLGGVLGSSAHSVNNRGLVAGVANVTGDLAEHAALWRDGIITDLGTLGGFNSNVDFPVKNDVGDVAGFAQTSTTDPLGEIFCNFVCSPSGAPCQGSDPSTGTLQSCRGFVWRSGRMKALGTLGGNNSAATGMNNRGLVVGLAENGTQDPNCTLPQALDYEAVTWDPKEDTIHQLPAFSADAIGAALAVNDKDQVVGGSGACGSGPGLGPIFFHAVLWQNDSVTELGNLGGALNNVAYAINDRTQVVGASDLAGDNTGHAFVWQHGVITDLGTLPGDFLSAAFGINDRAQVVGQSCDVNFNCRAFLWANGTMTDLNTLTLPGSSLYLVAAVDINSRGEIVGTAVDQSSGEPLAFQAIPITDSTAERGEDSTPKGIRPDKVRNLLQQRWGLRVTTSRRASGF